MTYPTTYRILAAVAVATTMVTGCAGKGLHTEALEGLEESRQAAAETTTEVEMLEAEQVRLSNAIFNAESLAASLAAQTQRVLEATQRELDRERELRKQTEIQIARLQNNRRQLDQLGGDIRRERNRLQADVEDLTGRLATAEDTLGRMRPALTGAQGSLAALEQEKTELSHALASIQSAVTEAQQVLEHTEEELAHEQRLRRKAESHIARLQDKRRQLDQLSGDIQRERDLLQANVEDLTGRLETTEDTLGRIQPALAGAQARLAALEQEKDAAMASLSDSRTQAGVLETELSEQQAMVAALQKEKQQLLSGTTRAQGEIAQLQRRTGVLETDLAAHQAKVAALQKERQQLLSGTTTAQDEIAQLQRRAGELDQQLLAQNQEIGRLGKAAADRENLAAQVTALTDWLEQSKQRAGNLTGALATLNDEAARTRQERDELTSQVGSQQETMDTTEQALALSRQREGQLQAQLHQQGERLKVALMEKSILEQERIAKNGDIMILTKSRAALSESLKAEAAERDRLKQERAAKEAEVQRLTHMHAALAKSLEAEMAKGDILIKQVRDKLTITLVDRVLFDSGRAQVKPDGLRVLTQVSDVLKHVTDKQIQIEGHTDNVPIGPKLIDRFRTNWELSTARATSVVRYLIDRGGVDSARLSAVGYADNRPVSSNDTEEGQARNRRIEIVLYPKDLTQIASKIGP